MTIETKKIWRIVVSGINCVLLALLAVFIWANLSKADSQRIESEQANQFAPL